MLSAVPLVPGQAEVRFPNGWFQPFHVIGADDATLFGVPALRGGASPAVLRTPDAVVVDAGGTVGKLETPSRAAGQWPHDGPRLDVSTRELAAGDELLVNDHRVFVVGRSEGLPRYPPRPLLYTTLGNATRILLPERRRLTFVLATAMPGVSPRELATRVEARTGLSARSSADFTQDTVRWMQVNSYVGDIAAQAGCAPCRVPAWASASWHCRRARNGGWLPFRFMWFTPLLGDAIVLIVSLVAAALSARTVLKLQPASVFAGR